MDNISKDIEYAPITRLSPVSYTHLDVYKRQTHDLYEAEAVQVSDKYNELLPLIHKRDSCLLYTSSMPIY